MSFVAQMRIGSLEISAALLAAATLSLRSRTRRSAEVGVVAPIQVRIRVIEFGRGRSVDVISPLTIGRAAAAGLVLSDSEVSRRHARLETESGRVFVRDLQSRNGTFLNGERLDAAIEVRVGDAIDVGATRLQIEGIEPWM